MEATTTPTPNVSPTPTPNAVATPTPTPTPTPEVAPTTPIMENGGTTSSSGGSFFSSLNWLEIAFSVLGVAALSYVIYYYRFKIKQDKLINNDLQRQIDELKMNMQTTMKGKYKTI